MKIKLGFTAEKENNKRNNIYREKTVVKPKRSLVRVNFPARNLTCSYYNDMFDLHKGDIVYVDGKLEGLRGRVVDVSYSFKIKLSEYKRVVAAADMNVKGSFLFADSHFITADEYAIPFEKVMLWLRAPEKNDDEVIFGDENTEFCLDDLSGMKVSGAVAERGHDYYIQNRVVYFEINNGIGRAIVSGSDFYTVEFGYKNRIIENITCSCYCVEKCKHEVAAMLQLKESLEIVSARYPDIDASNFYIAAICQDVFMENVFISGKAAKLELK